MHDFSMEDSSFWCAICGDLSVIHIVSQVLWVPLKEFTEVIVHHLLKERQHVH